MFRQLKRKFILTNLITSTIVLLIAFSTIYITAVGAANHRAEERGNHPAFEMPGPPPEQEPHTEQKTSTSQNPEAEQTQPMTNNQTAISFDEKMSEKIEAEKNASLQSLLISLIITGAAMEIIIVIISFFLAEQSIKPVREAYQAQKEFIANASHEIKTPLAIIQANLEATGITNNKWLNNAERATIDLANVNNQLLLLARSEATETKPKLENVDLGQTTTEIVSNFTPKAKLKNITVKLDLKSSKRTVRANRTALKQIMDIYVDNAIKYGKKQIVVSVNHNRIDVASDGKLISDHQLPHIFERFYQAEKTSEGVGLGLAIAKSLADKNHWVVSAHVDQKSKHNIFSLELK